MNINSMTLRFLSTIFVVTALSQPIAGYADQPQNAQAMEFGMMFGAAATLFDQCVQRKLIPAGTRPAEDQASTFMKASIKFTRDKEGFDGTDAVQKGWDLAKQKIHEQNQKYWEDNCDAIGKQWNKYVLMYKLQ